MLIQNVELDALHVVSSQTHLDWGGMVSDGAQPVSIQASK